MSQKGTKNSQHGTMWITNGAESKKITKNELIPEGWLKGRKVHALQGKPKSEEHKRKISESMKRVRLKSFGV